MCIYFYAFIKMFVLECEMCGLVYFLACVYIFTRLLKCLCWSVKCVVLFMGFVHGVFIFCASANNFFCLSIFLNVAQVFF